MSQFTIDDIYKLFQASQREADRRFAELAEDSKRRAAEADRRRAAEAEKRLAELENLVANTNKAVDNLTSRWGEFVKNVVEPAVVRLFQERSIPITQTLQRMKTKNPPVAMEIHILAMNTDVAVAVEVQSNLSKSDVDDFLEKLARFKQAFPRYSDVLLHGAVAGIEINEGIDTYASRRGLFVIQQSGEVVEIANDQDFRPGVW